MTGRRIRVLVVDDSSLVRQYLCAELPRDRQIEIVGAAPDPYIAREQLLALDPDVVTLDIQMPHMNGLSFLKKMMVYHPTPVVILSSLASPGSETSIEALALGAVDVMAKPTSGDPAHMADWLLQLTERIKAASMVDVKGGRLPAAGAWPVAAPPSGAMTRRTDASRRVGVASLRVIAIGASTGGPAAVRVMLRGMAPSCPGIVIVVHMPAGFTARFAQTLDADSPIEVREAVDGDVIRTGLALIAPGDRHLLIARSGDAFVTRVKDGPLVCRHKPSVEVLFQSAAKELGIRGCGVLLTGMGRDGADGLLSMKRAGAFTVAQDEATSVVYGMPREAVLCGAAAQVLPLTEITHAILAWGKSPALTPSVAGRP